jgi:hypothetical protein
MSEVNCLYFDGGFLGYGLAQSDKRRQAWSDMFRFIEDMPEAILITQETDHFDVMYRVYFTDIPVDEMRNRLNGFVRMHYVSR